MQAISLQNNTLWRKSLALLRIFLGGLFVAFLAIRFLVKDRIGVLSFAYYATPLPILAMLFLALGMIWWLGKRNRFAKLHFIFAAGCLIAWSCSSFSSNASAPAPGNLKLFFWNAAHNKRADEIAGYIRGFDADLIGIVEAGTQRKKVRNIWKNAFSSYHVEILAGEMVLMTRGEILSKESGSLAKRGRFNLLEVALNGERFHVLLVDIDGNPFEPRSPAFEPLSRMIRAYSGANLIVMGDFNTPLDSVLFESFRQYLNHAFESGGTGFAETWPLPLPVLAIDHIWLSKKIKVANCNLNWSRFSDHRSVVANIEPPRSRQ